MTGEDGRRLEAERQRIAAELRDYPRPVAGCDAQFNHLLERRAEIERALAEVAPTDPSAG